MRSLPRSIHRAALAAIAMTAVFALAMLPSDTAHAAGLAGARYEGTTSDGGKVALVFDDVGKYGRMTVTYTSAPLAGCATSLEFADIEAYEEDGIAAIVGVSVTTRSARIVFGISNGGAGAMTGIATVGNLDTGTPCPDHSFTWITTGSTAGTGSVPPPGKYSGDVSGSLSSPANGSLTLTGTGGSWATSGSLGTGACGISFDVAAPVVTPYDGGRAMRIADPGRRWSVDMVSLVDPSAREAGVAGFIGFLRAPASGSCPATIGFWAGERDGYVPSPSRKPPTLPPLPGLPGTSSARFATPPNFGTGDSAFVVFTGGSVTQLELEARRAGVSGIWVQNSSGQYVSYIVGAPASVNEAFRRSFPNGIPANTPLTVTRAPRTSRPPGATFAALEVLR